MFVEDFVTLANPNATFREQNEATLSLLSPFGKAAKGKKAMESLKDGLGAAQDVTKNANKGKDAQKATQKDKEQFGEYVKNLDKGTGNLLDDDLAKMYKDVQQGIGSTGRTIPNTLDEQLAMKQVLSNPLEGAKDLSDYIKMSDKGR